MSASSSDSEDSWAVVNPITESEGNESSSSNGSEYVHIEENAASASYHHRQSFTEDSLHLDSCDTSTEHAETTNVLMDPADETPVTDSSRHSSQIDSEPSSGIESSEVAESALCEDDSAADDIKEPMDFLDIPENAEGACSNIDKSAPQEINMSKDQHVPEPCSLQTKTDLTTSPSEPAACAVEELAAQSPSSAEDAESDIEDAASMAAATMTGDKGQAEQKDAKPDEWEILRRTPPQFRPGPMLKFHSSGGSDSASDHSDFVRLDGAEVLDAVRGAGALLGGDMHISTSSNASSISQSFRFVRPIHLPPRYQHQHQQQHHDDNDADDDDDSLPPDVDDRCESDISGVADDEHDEYDLSEAGVVDLGDLTISEGDVMRSYKHWPNPSLNTMLTILTLITLFLALGVGIGHYMGTVRETMFRKKQVEQIKMIQDDYLMCLRQQEIDEKRYASIPAMEERAALLVDEWQEKYEELILEKVELEQQIQSLEQDQLNELEKAQQQVAASRSQMDTLQSELHLLNINALDLQQQLDEEDAELLQQQRDADLYRQTLEKNTMLHAAEEQLAEKLKLLEQQLMVEKNKQQAVGNTVLGMRNELNQLKIENSDLKGIVSRQRYTHHSSNNLEDVNGASTSQSESPPESTSRLLKQAAVDFPANGNHEEISEGENKEKTELNNLHDRLTQVNLALQEQRGRSTRLHNLLLTERQKFLEGCGSPGADGNAGPDFFTCVSYLLPGLNLTEGLSPLADGAVNILQEHLEFLRQLKNDSGFAITFKSKWKELQGYMESSNWQKFREQADTAYEDMKNSIKIKWEAFNHSQQLGDIHDSLKKKWVTFNATAAAMAAQDKIGKVQSTLTDLQQKVKTTVQNLTSGNKFQTVYNSTKETVSQLSERIQTTWDKVKNLSTDLLEKTPGVKHVGDNIKKFSHKMQSKWDHVQKKIKKGWFKQNGKGKHKKNKKKSEHFGPTKQKPSYDEKPFFSDVIDEAMGQKFENKPSHKQKQSTNSEPDAYEEFWKKAEFTPDDLIQEGFFEGNNREWKKHQKRLRKLHGRIQRLSEEIFQSLDDDEIDDLYDDLDDLQDDIEDEDLAPEQLKTWLTCQTRWWKSRLYRKHRNQDLIKGCGQQLMKWQLRVLCKPVCRGDKCHYPHTSLYSFCQYYQTVIQAQGACNKKDHNCVINPGFPSDNPDQGNYENQPGSDPSADRDAKWYFEWAQERDNHHHDSGWYVRNMYHGTGKASNDPGRWLFDRASARDFERSKPWYYKRADNRENQHVLQDLPQPVDFKWVGP